MRRNVRLRGTETTPIRRHEGGFVAEGPGFYIWDEDREVVSRAVREIEQGLENADPPARLLILCDDFTPLPAA